MLVLLRGGEFFIIFWKEVSRATSLVTSRLTHKLSLK